MKNRIVYFGDSFVDDNFNHDSLLPDITPSDLWTAQLADRLNLPYFNYAEAGVGMDYILTRLQWELVNKKVTADDLIIIGLTSWDRKWIVRDYPQASHLLNLEYNSFWRYILNQNPPEKRPQIEKQLSIAKDYYTHSWNQPLSFTEHSAFNSHLIWLRNKHNLSLITIPTFQPIILTGEEYLPDPNEGYYNVTGYLNNSSLKEFGGDEAWKVRDRYIDDVWGRGMDIRPNHLSKVNHNILVDKLYDTITNNVPLNLEEDFISDIYK